MDYQHNHYLAGFMDGEGCLLINVKPRGPRTNIVFTMSIAQRLDRRIVLEQLEQVFGGVLWIMRKNLRGPEYPQMRWVVAARAEIFGLIRYLDEYPLVLKAREYNLWREAAMLYYSHSTGSSGKGQKRRNPQWLTTAMQVASNELKRLKKYDAEILEFSLPESELQLELL